jgi:hypothetical protein
VNSFERNLKLAKQRNGNTVREAPGRLVQSLPSGKMDVDLRTKLALIV